MTESNDRKGWLSEKLEDPRFRLGFEQEWAADQFCDLVESALNHENLTRSQLASRLGRSRAYITKALRRGRNLTLKTMVELLSGCGFELYISAKPRGEVQG